MPLNSRKDYIDSQEGQGSKNYSLQKASQFVLDIKEEISPLLAECIVYDSEKKLGNAPCVELPNGKLAIAPDLRCVTKKGNVFWFEIKDKSQRFFYPDTGADIFQVYGWYNTFKFYEEPVFILFKDPDFESCLPNRPNEKKKKEFKTRWDSFSGKPYGAWLGDLLELQNGYPRVFEERSRDLKMYILYFLIAKMNPVDDWLKLINEVDNKAIKPVPEEIKAYLHSNNTLLSEKNIRGIIASLFRG
ncbi:hypothetical protein [Tenacibaculum aestuarii]|uniref:hypothetical protein n=1 Tax=Tenacibaculum aestuarii TaxID=362781 RepID=UPI0038956B60